MIGFALKEGARNFRNLGLTGLLTLAALTATLFLLGVGFRGYLTLQSWSQGLLGRFEIEAFLNARVDNRQTQDLLTRIKSLPRVVSVTYVSKEEAARRFVEQFGSEVFDLLEYNPLPPSVIVTLDPRSDPSATWEATARAIGQIQGVDDVVYQGKLLADVRRFYRQAGLALLAVIIGALAVSLFFTILTVHNAIRVREEFIRVIAFSGGTRAMARGPFIATGAIYGVVSGAMASVFVELLVRLVKSGWGIESRAPIWWFPAMLGAGVIIGIFGAGWAAGRRIRDI